MAKHEQRLDETISGGKYLAADGTMFVNANGEPIKGEASSSANEPTLAELKIQAAELGIDDADKFRSKADAQAAIDAKQSELANANQGEGQ